MTDTDPGAERCALCKRKATHHRLTPVGRLYCLELAHHAKRCWFDAVEIDPGTMYRLPVGQLQAGEFPAGTGDALALLVSQ